MFLLPSLNRTEKLKQFFEAARCTEMSAPGIVIVDRADYLENQNAYIALERYQFPVNWKLHISDGVSMGDKIREKWDFYKDCDWVGVLNDDHIPVTPEWDARLINRLTGTNFVSCNDRWCAPQKAAGATLWSGDLMRAVGWIFPPGLRHLYIDDLWEHLGRQTCCWHIDMSVVIEHRHVFNGVPEDSTHRISYDQTLWNQDRDTYQKWLATDAPEVISRIRTLACKATVEPLRN